MYEKIEENLRMTYIEASAKYPDSYIIMRMDDYISQMGTVLYVGDNQNELAAVLMQLENQNHCGIIEGLNYHRNSL